MLNEVTPQGIETPMWPGVQNLRSSVGIPLQANQTINLALTPF